MSKEKQNIITLTSDDGNIEVEVIEQTVVEGTTYILVADITDDEEDGDCYILKDVSVAGDDMANYEVVSDEEADNIFPLFQNKLADDISLEK